MRFVPVAAILTMGLALYASRGVMDQIVTAAGPPLRVALLPPWQSLAGFVALGALGLLWLDRHAHPRRTTYARLALPPLLFPVFGLLPLLIPYLPVVPDVFPALQVLAGPLRGVIWLVIVVQLIWVFWQAGLLRADHFQKWTLTQSTIVVGLLTMIISGIAAARLAGTTLYPAGDEPHYLVMAQSLWRDGDLKIENNHAQRDYAEYFPLTLEPHYLTRGVDGEIYSIHPVGMPVLIAPVYAVAGYRGVVVFFVFIAALAAALMWHAVARATNALGAATFAWAAVVATTPFLFNSFAVYPEIPAALAAVCALTLTFGGAGPREPLTRWAIVGLTCAVLPWLSTKYAPMSAVLIVIALARIIWPAVFHSRPSVHEIKRVAPSFAAVLTPYVTSLVGWFYFFYAVWGTPFPQAPYGAHVQTSLFNLVFGAPGLLFDQEYGLLPYAPVLILAFTGLWGMWRDGGEMRRRAIEVAMTLVTLLGTVGAYRIWWGGAASPGRPLASSLLLLMLPVAMAFRRVPAGSTQRAAHHLLLWLSVGITTITLFAQRGFLIANHRDGTSSLLEYISASWPAWTAAPSFVYHEAPQALLHSSIWLVLAAASAFVLSRVRTPLAGLASLAAIAVCFIAVLIAALVVPSLPATPPWPGLDPSARARLSVLDDYDAVARPVGVEYAPLRLISAAEVPTRASLLVAPGVRVDPQPIRVLHNGRFSVPAGRYRVEVDWIGARQGETLGLQIGRSGDAWRTFPVEPRADERWTTEFEMPVDASFVGLRGSAELEKIIGRIAINPISIVDAASRPRVPTVIGASQYGDVAVFYYDDNVSPEPTGFWLFGDRRKSSVSIHRSVTHRPLILHVHSGLIDNRLQLSMPGWTHTMVLKREAPERIEIPAGERRLITLQLMADLSFVPMQIDPAARDARPLGVWIEMVRP